MKRVMLIFMFLVFILYCVPARAGGGEPTVKELMEEIRSLKARVAELEAKVSEQSMPPKGTAAEGAQQGKPEGPIIKKFHEREVPIEKGGIHVDHKRQISEVLEWEGFRIGANVTAIVQGTPNANNAGADEDSRFDGSWKGDIDIEHRFADWGRAFIELEIGQGDTLNGEMALFSIVNNNANDTGADVIGNKFYYEQYLFDKQFTVTAGKLDPTDYFDDNKYANDDTSQFLGGLFNNSPVLEWPSDNAFGLRAEVSPKSAEFLVLSAGFFEGDANWEDVFEGGVYIGQVNLRPATLFGADPEQYEGNYRFYGWVNDRFHTKLTELGQAESSDNKEINYGFGLTWDQMVTDVFGFFTRCGWQRPDLIPADGGPTVEWMWSAGAQMTGKYWNREEDVIAVAVGQLFPSEEYKRAADAGFAEGHFEAYYRCQLNPYLGISPDFQVIWNPNGIGKSSPQGDHQTIFVYGARAHLDF